MEDVDADSSELLTRYGREIDRLKKQISEVLAENEDLHKERKRLIDEGRTKEDWDELQELINTLMQENKLLISKNEDSQEEIQRMERKVQKQREEIQQLQEEKGEQDRHAQKTALELSRLRDENSRLQRENARLHADAQIHHSRDGAHEGVDTGSRHSHDSEHRDRVIQDMTNEHVREVSRLREQIQQLESAVNGKERQIVHMQSKQQEATSLVTALRDRLDTLHQEKRRLSDRLAEVELNYEASMQERAQYLAHLDSVVKIAEHRKHELEALMSATQTSKAERDRALMEAAARDAKLEAVSRQLAMEQQQARNQLLDAVDMVRMQRTHYRRLTERERLAQSGL